MRFAELIFLVLLVVYHAFLLIPRYRRPLAFNYLVFVAGAALAWNLGLEGLRWQTLPPIILFLIDLLILFPTFATLRGTMPNRGFFRALGRLLRTLIAWAGWLLAVGALLLAVAFPLPRVDLTGGLPPSQRLVRFPVSGGRPALEIRLWYPASGDLRPLPRPVARAEVWQRIRASGGLPVFWQSYEEKLPTSLVKGGKLASSGTKYPVVYVALPEGEDPDDFGYLFEDLASRGFLVAAGIPLPGPLPAPQAFEWRSALSELALPFLHPRLWLEPEASTEKRKSPADYRWLAATKAALEQLDAEPGDLLFASIDWKHQGLWAWGTGGVLPASSQTDLGLRCVLQAGGRPPADHRPGGPELWISGGAPSGKEVPGQWFLTLPRLHRADLADAAYLKPYLTFFGLKAQADAGVHGALRQYQAAFFQYAFWASGADTTFGQTVPEVQGLLLSGK
jgi:hypothetical protein